MQKNTASQKFVVFAFNRTTNAPITGDAANITANLQIDFGTSTATNDVNPTELEDGFYSFDATQAETNGDSLVIYPASVTSDIQVIGVPAVLYTVSTGSPDEVVQTVDNNVLAAGATGFAAIDTVVDAVKVITDQFVFTTANQVDSNMLAISSDGTAADNLELQYDGTGLIGDNFPSTQEQIGNISSGAGGLSRVQASFTNTDGGTETNAAADTETLNGTVHTIDDNAGNTDYYYEFDLGVSGVATSILWNGYVNSNGDSAAVQLYNWVGAAFEDVDSITGSNGTTISEMTFPSPNKYTGTGANSGKVRFGFNSATATSVSTDRVLCVYTSIVQESLIFSSGIAQAGGNNSIQLASGAVGSNDQFRRAKVILISGTGAGQEAIITSSLASTDTLTTTPAWSTNPDSTSYTISYVL